MSSTTAAAPSWPELKADHPIIALFQKLPEILTASEGYNEIWGINLVGPTSSLSPTTNGTANGTEESTEKTTPVEQPSFGTGLILQKFLRANSNDLDKAFSQLKDTLTWRKEFFSPGGESSKGWSDSKFEGIGYTTVITHKNGDRKVVSWNIYGAAKDIKGTFGNLDEFIRWRVNLMESSLKLLHLESATEPIPDFGAGNDQYQSLQVHDYMNVSFLRLPSEVKTASKKTIQMFARYYPETLERKFFVNVPMIMSWVYLLMRKVVASETMKKLEMRGDGKELAGLIGEDIPEMYGGKSQPLDAGDNGVQSPTDVDGATAESMKKEGAPKEKEEPKKEEEATKKEETPVTPPKEEAAVEAPKEETPNKDAPKEEAPKEDAPQEDAPQEDTPMENGVAAEPVKEPEFKPADATPKAVPTPIEPLPLTEPVTAEPVVTEQTSKPNEVVETPKDAVAPAKTLSEVPIPAPAPVLEKKDEAPATVEAEKKE